MFAVVVATHFHKHVAASPRTVMRFLDSRFARSMTEAALHKSTQQAASTLMSVSQSCDCEDCTNHARRTKSSLTS